MCPCQRLGLFLSYLLDLFFVFSLIFFAINHIFSLNRRTCFFAHFLECFLLSLDDNVDEETSWFSNSKSSASACCLAFAHFFFANFSLVLLTKVLLINKACILVSSLMLLIYCSYANYNQRLKQRTKTDRSLSIISDIQDSYDCIKIAFHFEESWCIVIWVTPEIES